MLNQQLSNNRSTARSDVMHRIISIPTFCATTALWDGVAGKSDGASIDTAEIETRGVWEAVDTIVCIVWGELEEETAAGRLSKLCSISSSIHSLLGE